MAVFFLLMLLVYVAGNIYIYVRGLQAVHFLSPGIKWLLSIGYWLVPLSFILIFLFRSAHIPLFLSHTLFQIGTGWLVFTLYMVLLLGCFDLVRIFYKSFSYGFVWALLLTACILVYGYMRYQRPATKVINLTINKQTTTPVESMTIVAISDVHLGLGTVKSKLRAYVEKINQLKPDVILIGGDLIDNSITPVIDQQMQNELSMLNARYGVFMAPGNHEYISGIQDCIAFLEQTPVRLLQDTVVTLPNGVQIVGRDDRHVRNRKSLQELMHDIRADNPVIVVDHQPFELNKAAEAKVDLLLCGHTHNGQVWPLNLLTKRMFERSYGYEKRDQTHIYITSGLSLWGPPFRIGTQSEIVQIQLTINN